VRVAKWLARLKAFCDRLAFEWVLNEPVLQRLRFAEVRSLDLQKSESKPSQAKMNVSDVHRAMEKQGLSTDILPIKALYPGKATVKVSLKDMP